VKAVVMARKRRAPKYAGELAKPIYVDMDQIDRLEDVLRAREPEKIYLLFKHYRIDPSDEQGWAILARHLAFDHVPGLQLAFRPKRGPKPSWKTGQGDKFVGAVDDMKSQTGMRTQEAIGKLRKDKPGIWGRYTVENLGARYWEAKRHQKQFRKLVEEACERRARGQKLDELSALLLTDEN
jgi:hypothetical protein